jgi:hypothetical protein
LAQADRDPLRFPRRDDAGASRLVAQAPGAARPGAKGLARLLPQTRLARHRALAARGAARALPAARRTILRIGALYIALRYGAQASAAGVARLRRLVREF